MSKEIVDGLRTELSDIAVKLNSSLAKHSFSVPLSERQSPREEPPLTLPPIKTKKHSSSVTSPTFNVISRLKKKFDIPEPTRRVRTRLFESKKARFYRHSKAKVMSVTCRNDPLNYPPQITEDDVGDGILALVYKGLIPKDSDVSPAFKRHLPPLSMRSATLNDRYSQQVTPRKPKTFVTQMHQLHPRSERKEGNPLDVRAIGDPKEFIIEEKKIKQGPFDYFPLMIKGGKLKYNEHLAEFKEKYMNRWGFLRGLLTRIENYCKLHRITKLVIDGKKFYEAFIDEVGQFSIKRLNGCILNEKEVQKKRKIPETIYKGTNGRHLAAIRLQTAWRRFKDNQNYRFLHALNKRATTIQTYFRLYLEKLETKRKIAAIKNSRTTRTKQRQKNLIDNWSTIKTQERVEIHIGSQMPERLSMNYYTSQNHQISRIFRAYDPLISVIYISPTVLHVEIPYYYYCFLERCQIPNPREKVKFVTPDHGLDTKELQYTTSKLLNYAFKTINELKELIEGKTAMYVPGDMTEDDVIIADLLDIPIFSGDIQQVTELTTQLKALEIFKEAGIPTPLTVQVTSSFNDTLANLIFENAETDYWVLKLNSLRECRGIASINLSSSKYMKNFRKKLEKNPDPDIPEIKKDLEDHLKDYVEFTMPTAWHNFDEYLENFYQDSGFIQITPTPMDVKVTAVCVCLLIEPSGDLTFIGAADRVQSRNFLNVGAFFPQLSLPQDKILDISRSVCANLYQKGIFGFVSLELLVFPDNNPESQEKHVWGLGLKLGMDFTSCGILMFLCLIAGNLDIVTGKCFIEYEEEDDDFALAEDVYGDDFTNMLTNSKPRARSKYAPLPLVDGSIEERPNFEDFNMFDERALTLVWHVEHPDIVELSVGAFFHMCRLESLIYNMETIKGATFTVYSPPVCKYLGALSIGSNRLDAIKAMNDAFKFIIQQAGPPPQPLNAVKDFPVEQINFIDITSQLKAIYQYLEKLSKQGKKGFVMNVS